MFDPTFDFSKTSELTFDENYVEVKNGKVQFKPLDLKHEGDDLNNNSHVGSFYDSSKQKITMIEKSSSLLDLKNVLPTAEPNLLGYWKLENNYQDMSGNSNHGIAIGANSFTGEALVGSYSLSTPGGNGFGMKVPDASKFDSLSQFSLSLWVKFNSLGTKRTIAGKGENLKIEIFASNQLCFWARPQGQGSTSICTSAPLISDKWYHISGTYSGVERKLYVDGQEVNNGPLTGVLESSSYEFLIGSNAFPDELTFIESPDANIDEVAIWNDSLSSSQILNIYNSQRANFSELSLAWVPKWNNIVGYWKMDGDWQDSSGNGVHGTSFGGATFSSDLMVGSSSGMFDGIDGYVSTVAPSLGNRGTTSFWVKHRGAVGSGEYIFDSSSGSRYLFYDYNGGTTGWNFFLGNTEIGTVTGDLITPNVWTHIAISYDSSLSSEKQKVYKNGQLHQAFNISFSGVQPANFYLGRRFGASDYLNGNLDDFVIWDTPLNASEVNTIYQRQKQKYAGHYDSEVIDLGGTTSSWPDLSWLTSLPFGKELVGDSDNDGSPDSESSSDYSLIMDNLSNGLVGYWKFENNFDDSSGNGFDATIVTSSPFVTNHVLGHYSGYFDGDDYLTISNTINPVISNEITVSSWVLRLEDTAGNHDNILTEAFLADGNVEFSLGVNFSLTGPKKMCAGFYDGSWSILCDSTDIDPGKWIHFTATYDGNYIKLYKNGELAVTSIDFNKSLPLGTEEWRIGRRHDGGNYWNGYIDEIGLWSRALGPIEIQQLYRRGANRIKFQVKSCIDSSCECKSLSASPAGSATDCDGDTILNALDFDDIYKAKFIGPGGDGTTYYSELFNRTGTDLAFNCGLNTSDSNSNVCVDDEITLGAGPRPTSPVIDYSDFPLAARPDANPYFQYRVYMEADENIACDGSPCLPELTSVNLNPDGSDKFYGALQEVVTNKPISYSTISSLMVTADDCATYQLSPNGSDFYYWSSSSWVLATAPDHRSSKNDLETNIVIFSSQFGPGLLYIKSFLETNASQTQNCSVQSIDLNYSRK